MEMSSIHLAEEAERANGGDEFRIISEAALSIFGWTDDRYKRVLRLLEAGTSLDAAMTLVPSDPWLEIRGPRKYLNIPTRSPNFWSANVSCWNHEGQKTGWGATPALALTAAALRARAAAQVSA